jgi:hypothetical protein
MIGKRYEKKDGGERGDEDDGDGKGNDIMES